MRIAIWIIAITEVVRLIQNTMQLVMMHKSSSMSEYKRATDAFIQSLSKTDKQVADALMNMRGDDLK